MPTADAHGVEIAFDDVGTGGPPLLLLTGWCSSRGRYDPFVPLAAEHRRVVAFDWRGHGDSAAAPTDFGLAEQVEDALAVVEAAGLDEFVPVSASHSGWVAIELRRRLGPRVPRIVHMDWLVVEPSTPYMDVIRMLQTDRWPDARETLFRIWRNDVSDPAVDGVIDVMDRQGEEMWRRSGREIEAAYATGRSPLDALARLDPPPAVLHLYGQPPDDAYLERQRSFSGEHDWFTVERLPARTHFAMTETPSEAVAAIERFLSRPTTT